MEQTHRAENIAQHCTAHTAWFMLYVGITRSFKKFSRAQILFKIQEKK